MRQHRTVILPSFATIFLCSLLLAASFTAFGAVMRVLSMEKNLYAIEAFLPESVSEDSLKVIENRLEHTKFVDSVAFVSADSALADFRKHFSGEMLDLVEGNPIPPFFRVTLDKENKEMKVLVYKSENDLRCPKCGERISIKSEKTIQSLHLKK